MKWSLFGHRKTPSLDVTSLASLEQQGINERMETLERLIVALLGQRQEAFGEPQAESEEIPLPRMLRRFYSFAGRWQYPHPERSPVSFESPEESYFYAGATHAHLAAFNAIELTANRHLAVFSEHSGNWSATVEPEGEDPCVWIEGDWGEGESDTPLLSSMPLSVWLFAHVLSSIAWESGNSYLSALSCAPTPATQERSGLMDWFQRHKTEARLLWESRVEPPELAGNFYLFRGAILVHEFGTCLRFAALTSASAQEMRHYLGQKDFFDA
jgi:hypothetical protein